MTPYTQNPGPYAKWVTIEYFRSLPRFTLFKITSPSTIFLDPCYARTSSKSFKKDIKGKSKHVRLKFTLSK